MSEDDQNGQAISARGGEHQNLARTVLVLNALASADLEGLRLIDICAATGLGKTAVHRLMAGLTAFQMATFSRDTGRYHLGDRINVWAERASAQFELSRRIQPYMRRLEEEFHDTVYFLQRRDDDVHCLARVEGSYPIKTLTLNIGDVRPLGAGSGGLAVAAALLDAEVQEVISRRESQLASFGISVAELLDDIAETRKTGHSVIHNRLIPGMTGVGKVILGSDSRPIGAITMVAINDRMDDRRRAEIVSSLTSVIARIQGDLSGLIH